MSSIADAHDVETLRAREYPWAERAVYLNAAGTGPLPERSRRAVEAFNRRRHEAFRLGADALVEVREEARELLARLLGVDPAEVALGPSTSWGLSVAAGLVEAHADEGRGTIVVSDGEFPANVYPWLALERRGLRVERVPTDALGRPRDEALLERLDRPDVAAFAVSAVQFATGYRTDLGRFGRLCRERDILFVVDAIQGVGALPLAVRDSGVDVLACGGQKWLCGPFGSGFTYVRRALSERYEPRAPGWLAFASSTDFEALLDYRWELLPDARRYENGTIGFQDFVGLNRSVELLLEIGIDRVWDHIRAVQAPLVTWASERGDVRIVSDLSEAHRSGLVCLRPPRAADVHAALEAADVVCALREGAIRFAPHFYNTVDEMEQVVDILERTMDRGR